jgi:hypothetical protein
MMRNVLGGAAALGLLTAAVFADEVKKEFNVGPVQVQVITSEGPAGGAIAVASSAIGGDEQAAAKPSEYWIGVSVGALDDEARKQRKLPEDGGVLVADVLPDSPAAKAGIQADDVLVKAGGKALKSPADLVAAVGASKGGKVELELLRGEKTVKLTVAPAKRPAELAGEPQLPPLPAEALRKWMNQLQVGEAKPENMQFHILGPGAIVQGGAGGAGGLIFGGAAVLQPLPDDMTITITKTGKKPAEITVKQGDKKWEATEESLDKLPKEVRPHVDGLMGRAGFPFGVPHVRASATAIPAPGGPGAPAVPPPVKVFERPLQRAENLIEKRLEAMDQRIEKLTRLVEELREARGKAKAPKEPAKEGEKKPEAKEKKSGKEM